MECIQIVGNTEQEDQPWRWGTEYHEWYYDRV